jgi:hypothetical protein
MTAIKRIDLGDGRFMAQIQSPSPLIPRMPYGLHKISAMVEKWNAPDQPDIDCMHPAPRRNQRTGGRIMTFKAGHIFNGPDGQGYELTHDLVPLTLITLETFKPFGGAPVPSANDLFTPWLAEQLQEAQDKLRKARE